MMWMDADCSKNLGINFGNLNCFYQPDGSGKDGASAQKQLSVTVNHPSMSFNSYGDVQVDIASLYSNPGKPFAVTGTVSSSFVGPLRVALVDISYAGSSDWNSVNNLVKDGSGYTAVMNAGITSGTSWSAQFGGLPESYYHVFIFDGNNQLKGTGLLVSTWKG